jgi:hypothetical protein
MDEDRKIRIEEGQMHRLEKKEEDSCEFFLFINWKKKNGKLLEVMDETH